MNNYIEVLSYEELEAGEVWLAIEAQP